MGLFSRKEPERTEGGELLFCPAAGAQEALSALERLFSMQSGGAGNRITLRNGDMVITFTAFGVEEKGESGEYAGKQLRGVWSCFRQIKTGKVDIQRNLLYHLRQCKVVLQVHYAFNSAGEKERGQKRREVFSQIFRAVSALRGVVTGGGAASLLDGEGRLILDGSGNSALRVYMPAELPPPDSYGAELPPESRERRDRSMALLRGKSIYVTPWLPLLPETEDGPPRTLHEICGRAGALLSVALYSECRLAEKMDFQKARAFVRPVMDAYQAEEFLSPRERAYLDDPGSSEQEQIQFAWQYENLLVMEWALGLAELPWPDHICDVPKTVRRMRERPTLRELEQASALRGRRELLDAADLIYRMDWACVDARVMGFPAPAGLDAGVVAERHRALFWLAACDKGCGWDEVDLST